MKYFDADFMQFFRELAPNNHKEWFDANRKRYENKVRDPFKRFVSDVIAEIGELDEALKGQDPKQAIFRINRDIRFSKDKSPYKLHVSAAIAPHGKKDMTFPGLYLEFNPEHVRLYSGVYMPDREQLNKLRHYLASHQKDFLKLIGTDEFKDLWGGTIHGEKHKVLPKELKNAAQKLPLLFNKQFYYYADMPPEMAESPDLMQAIKTRYEAILPLNRFLRKGL
jgi:uncharacterized protein (TIGR02453 family)